MTLVRVLHVLGIGLWLGGVAAALVLAGVQGSEPESTRGAAYRTLGKVYAWIVAPGAILTSGSGLAFTMMVASAGYGARLGEPAVAAMQALGLLAGVLEIFVSFPTSQRLARIASLDDGSELSPAAERMKSRTVTVSSVSMALVVIAVYLGIAGAPHGG